MYLFTNHSSLQCLHHGATYEPLCAPTLSSQTVYRWLFAVSVEWLQCESQILQRQFSQLLCYKMSSTLLKSWWLSRFKIWGTYFMSESSVFPIMVVWIERCFSVLMVLYNGQNIAAYEAYWLMGFPLINHLGRSLMHHNKPVIIYIYKREILSVCLSVRLSVCHAVNSPGTVDIAISTAWHQKPTILLLQVCHRE